MKISVAKDDLAQGLQAVQNVIGARTTLPVLSNVVLVAGENRLELRATDLDVSVHAAVPAKVESVGATSLPAKRLFGLVREIESAEVEIEVDGKEIATLQAAGASYKLHGIGADQYPPQAKFKESAKVSVGQGKLREMIRKTSYAVSQDESRPVLKGINVVMEPDRLTMVATDGRRLALVEEEIEGGVKAEFIVPSKAITELQRLLQGEGRWPSAWGKSTRSLKFRRRMGSRSSCTANSGREIFRITNRSFPEATRCIAFRW